MDRFLSHYTPSLMPLENLEGIFVQRDRLLSDLLDNIEKSVLTEAKHHALLIGPRGIGKTHLISMIYHRVAANQIFKDKLKIAWLREEEWGIATFLDLLVRILNALIDEYNDHDLQQKVNDLYTVSTDQAEQLAGHILKQYCQGQTLLLLMENLDEIFKGLEESGQQAFRAYLQNYGFITIVASSQSLFSGVQSRNLPFYGFFNLTYLKPLSLDEAVELLAKIAQWRDDEALANLLRTAMGKSRIRAIHHLAGGNHRIYIIFSQFLTTDSLDSLVEPFMKTLDDLTPFYQSRMQFISPQQRKIIEYLCEQRGAISVKEIAQHCFISPQTASSQLKSLKEMGYVYADSQGRESFYELQEPLMRICLEAKKRRGEPNQLFISFLRIWYCREELENRLQSLPLEAIFDRECTRLALAEMETSEDPKISALLRDWNDAWIHYKHTKMLEISEELTLVRGSGLDWIKKAHAYYVNSRPEREIIECLEIAIKIEPNNAEIWTLRASIFNKINLWNDAMESYEKSINIDCKNAVTWSLKAFTEALLNRKQEAKKSIKYALSLNKNDAIVFENAAFVYREIGDQVLSDFYISKCLEINPNNDGAWRDKAASLMNSDKIKSLEYAEKALSINPNSSENYLTLAAAYFTRGDHRKALDSIDKSINLLSDDSRSWMMRGVVLANLNESVSSVNCLGKVIKLNTTTFSNDLSLSLSEIAREGIKLASEDVLAYILKLGTVTEAWLEDSQSMIDLYCQHNLLTELSGGLVESIKAINEPSTSDHTAQAWLEMWQDLAGSYPEFKVALNLLNVAVQYKIHKNPRILLQLPQEERQILKELLSSETTA